MQPLLRSACVPAGAVALLLANPAAAPATGAAGGEARTEGARGATGPAAFALSRGPLAVAGPRIRRGDFETGDLTQWRGRTGSIGVQSVEADRIRVVRRPVAQGRFAGRFEVRHGDAWRGSGGNRAELVQWSGEREGEARWYAWSTLFSGHFPRIVRGWQIFTQWHASRGGTQPMLVFYARGDRIGFRTVESDRHGRSRPSRVHWTAPMDRGAWHHFVLRVRWSAERSRGLVELWHNGTRVVPPRPVRTLIPGQEAYMKQGLYRAAFIRATGVVFHDGLVIHRG